MKWNFLGFYNWPADSGDLDLLQGFDVFRASLTRDMPRETCEGCVCWRETGTCRQVQVDDLPADSMMRANDPEGYASIPASECLVSKNCCPILFFDFIGRKLPVLDVNEGGKG